MDEYGLLVAGIEDRIRQCEERYMITNTAFLDLKQRSEAERYIKKSKISAGIFWGGYPEAERCMLIFVPDYVQLKPGAGDIFEDYGEDNPLAVIRAEYSGKGRELSHRDFLGSLMALGIKRECIGDIIVNRTGADIIVMKEMCDFLVYNYGKAGSTYLNIEKIDFSQLSTPEIRLREKSDTVASLRLDNVISSAFGVSRGTAAESIKTGLVFVNSIQTEKTDFQVKCGDVLVLRGKGKAVLSEVGGKSRKDRIYIKTGIYE
ncbi:MAG: YlmH/Sll1252 family protein [Bacillota bacterium]|nr:YlmH/Sll1252 family protein [Bacillota bacterium]